MLLALILSAYTNHAGLAVAGVPVRIEPRFVTLSNATETVRVPLSIFPTAERRRIAADAGSTQLVPREVRLALAGLANSVDRVERRFAKGFVTREERDAAVRRAVADRKAYLDRQVREGLLSQKERQLLE